MPPVHSTVKWAIQNGLAARIEQENAERQRIINHLRLEIAICRKLKPSLLKLTLGLQTCLTRETDLKVRIGEEENNLKNLICELESQQKLEADQKAAV